MVPLYVLIMASATVISLISFAAAILVAGVALYLALRPEIIKVGGKLAGIRAPRPETVDLSPAEADA